MKRNFKYFNDEWNGDTKPPSDDDMGTRGRVPKDTSKLINKLIYPIRKFNGN